VGRSADQAVRSLANIDGLLERARSYGVRGFVQFAEDIDEEWSSGAGHAEGMVEADGQSIEIVTVHSSKGLEWPVVIPINRASMPRRAEKFVYRRSDESLHWALGQIIPPGLGDALQTEEIEKRNENLRLLYVACTRAMELLIVPDFSWSNDASWAKLLDFQLGEVPELNIARLPRKPAAAADTLENQQSEEVFAAEQLRLVEASPSIRWIRPSDGDPDLVTIPAPSEPGQEGPLAPLPAVEGGRLRGVVLHKLMEELITGDWMKILTPRFPGQDGSLSNWPRLRLAGTRQMRMNWRTLPYGHFASRKSSPSEVSSQRKFLFMERPRRARTN
jgi:CRISPR-associated exonuclease Cas4